MFDVLPPSIVSIIYARTLIKQFQLPADVAPWKQIKCLQNPPNVLMSMNHMFFILSAGFKIVLLKH